MHDIKRVAVIGAGVSGVSAGAHLKKAGLQVTIFERGTKAGGVWVYDDRTAIDPEYPSVLPSTGDSPAWAEYVARHAPTEYNEDRNNREDSPLAKDEQYLESDLSLLHAPPGPCYVSLKNNVSTIEMELRTNKWQPGTEEFVSHNILAEYIQDTARQTDIESQIKFGTRVDAVDKVGSHWTIRSSKLAHVEGSSHPVVSTEDFDAVVVASGHYHACNIPDTPGLKDWKQRWPDRVKHSKGYRNPAGFEGQNVLLIGSGVSSWDIAKDIAPVARTIYQVSRGGAYDLPAAVFPDNTVRIGDIAAFETIANGVTLAEDGSLPGTVYLKSGHKLCDIHKVILCTGYHMSYPFLPTHHSDTVNPEDADEKVLVTKDGQRTHNLHKDIFYIPDPTLAFIGVPYHVATFSLFDFQAITVAAVYGGFSDIPNETAMRQEYNEKTRRRGAGRAFHSLKGDGAEIEYVEDLMSIVNQNAEAEGRAKVEPHTQAWREAYARRAWRLREKFGQISAKPEQSLDDILSHGASPCAWIA